MSLRIEQKDREGIVVLEMNGALTLGEGNSELRDQLAALRQAGKVNVLLDLHDVSQIDSSGLGLLVYALANLRKSGGRLALVNLNPAHLALFSLTRLATVFELFDDEQSAINSFFAERDSLRHYDILEFVQHDDEPGAGGTR